MQRSRAAVGLNVASHLSTHALLWGVCGMRGSNRCACVGLMAYELSMTVNDAGVAALGSIHGISLAHGLAPTSGLR